MDVGNSLNPTIDIGQVEGAFVQGYGWCMLEETIWGSPTEYPWLRPGTCFTRGPGTYKIPSFNDVPIDMRVTLLKDAANPHAIHSSKAVGEPPLFLASSAFFATKNAIKAFRSSNEHFTVHSPLNPERARMACEDFISKEILKGKGKDYRPRLFC